LRDAGHEVFTPTLTGLGERAHLATPETSLATHTQDIANVLFYEDLRDVILAGHSYGGMVISGVADQMPERIGHLAYIDAFVPADGQSMLELRSAPGASALPPPDGWRQPVLPGYFGVTDIEDVAWLERNLVPQPLRTLSDKARISQPLEARPFARSYIYAAGTDSTPPAPHFTATYSRLGRDPAWEVHKLPSGHDMMVTMPGELAQILLAMTSEALG
jgi:pimeloyl-ACP methyl ester carboxylesterase